jgi:hypothetical protein
MVKIYPTVQGPNRPIYIHTYRQTYRQTKHHFVVFWCAKNVENRQNPKIDIFMNITLPHTTDMRKYKRKILLLSLLRVHRGKETPSLERHLAKL